MLVESSNTLNLAGQEQDLLSRARQGDRQAQAELYERHIHGSASIKGLLRRSVPNEHEREDLLHEIYLAAVEGSGEFRGDSKLSTYLFRVAQLTVMGAHRAANTQKRGGHVRVITEADWTEQPSLEPQSQHLEYEEVDVRLALGRLLEQVPEAYREALRLRIVEELEYQEIAERLQIPINTVSTRIFKGKNVLVPLLRKAGFQVGSS
jgi:RNA polymerase sigma-70 factor, ECF subfamily